MDQLTIPAHLAALGIAYVLAIPIAWKRINPTGRFGSGSIN
jgi:hypothetical protein